MMIDRKRAEAAMSEFLQALGLKGPELAETPARVTAAYADELLAGYQVDVRQLIVEGSELIVRPSDPVIVDGIRTATVCPHHFLVAEGSALVAYVPGERVLGLGVVARLVNACSRRLALQEEIAGQVADALMEHAGARGAFCRLQFNHACLRARGATQSSAEVITWAGRGSLENPTLLETVLGRFITGQTDEERMQSARGSASAEPSDAEFAAPAPAEEVSRIHEVPDGADPA